MKRVLKSVPADEHKSIYEVTISGDPCTLFTMESKVAQNKLLKESLSAYGMLDCGPVPFEKMNMFHDGEKWVMVLTATG